MGGDYGRKFIRTCAHLAYPAARCGYGWLDFHDVVGYANFGYDVKLFRDALARECRKRSAEPIADILNSPEPANYCRVWEHLAKRIAQSVTGRG